MKKFNGVINKSAEAAHKLIFLVCAIICVYISIQIFAKLETIYPAVFFILLFVLYSLFNALGDSKAKFSSAVYIAALIVISMVLKTTFALNTNAEPISDFAVQFKAAEGIANGNAAILADRYFQTWAYQTGYSIWMAAFIKFFGANAVFFKVLNAVYLTMTNILVYLFARRFTSEKTARCFGILYAVLPSVYFLTPVLTNQHLSNLLIFFGIYLYIAAPRKNIPLRLAAGAALALGNAVRPTAIVAVAAILFFEILNFLSSEKDYKQSFKQNFKRSELKSALITAASYFAIFFILSFMVKISGLNQHGLANTFPAWKLVVGLNIQTGGTYSAEDEKKIYSIADAKERDKKAMETLKERLSVPPAELYYLFMTKIKKMWCDFDSPEWAFYNYPNAEVELPVVEKIPLKVFLQKISSGFNSGIFILMAAACIRFIKSPGSGETRVAAVPTLLAVVFLVYFGAHLFIEIQPRYRDFAMIPIFTLSAFGFERIFESVNKY